VKKKKVNCIILVDQEDYVFVRKYDINLNNLLSLSLKGLIEQILNKEQNENVQELKK
jgi:hypothetical protein